jgi:hypothetical protein
MNRRSPLRISLVIHFYGVLLKTIRGRGDDLCIISSGEERLTQFASSADCRAFAVPITRQITPLSDLAACLRIFRFFLKNRFDIVHVHTPKGGIVGLSAAFLARLPVRIYTIHGLPLETASGVKRKLLWLFQWLKFIVVLSYSAVGSSDGFIARRYQKLTPEEISFYRTEISLIHGIVLPIVER